MGGPMQSSGLPYCIYEKGKNYPIPIKLGHYVFFFNMGDIQSTDQPCPNYAFVGFFAPVFGALRRPK
jgi:hypothetical protein